MKRTLKILLLFLAIVTGLILLTVIGFLLLDHATKISSINSFIQRNQIFFMVWRYSLMLIIIYYYPAVMHALYADRHDIDQIKLIKYSRRRYVVITLILIEILIVQNGLAWFINKLIGL